MEMSIESMTGMSYLLFGISGAFAVTAVIFFFVLDIIKCWRMVSGKYPVRREKPREAYGTDTEKIKKIIKIKKTEKTEPLKYILAEENSTEIIGGLEFDAGCEETLPLADTKALEMIQDIVYVQDAVKTE